MVAPRKVPRSSYYLTAEQVAQLRDLAQRLGYRQTRGAGTGEIGSVSALLAALAAAYDTAPATATETIRRLFADTGERSHD